MQESILTSVILPASLFIIMLGMGLSLTVADFKRVVAYPKAVIIGLVNQLVLLPLLAILLISVFGVSPLLAVGVMLLAACPGGVTSNLISHVARGDTALSVSLTAVSSFITVVAIPLIVQWALDYYMGDIRAVDVPITKTILTVVVITLIPITIGMIVRSRSPHFADRMDKPVRIASTVIFVAIIAGVIAANVDVIVPAIKQVGLLTLLLNVLTMGLGFASARLLQLNRSQSVSIAIESGIQNGTMAIVIGTSVLQIESIEIPAAVYGLAMFLTGGLMMWYFGRSSTAGEPDNTDINNSLLDT